MAAESKKSTEKADQRNNLLLCDNIQKMAELIRDDKRVNVLMTEVTSLYLPCGRTTLLSVFHIRLFA